MEHYQSEEALSMWHSMEWWESKLQRALNEFEI